MSVKTEEQAQARALKNLEGGAPDDYVPDLQTTAPVVQVQPSGASLQVAGYVVMAANVICGVMASRRGEHWNLSESETGDLHIAVARVAEKYISIDLTNPLMQLAAVMGAILVPRLAIELVNHEKNQPVAEQSEQSKDGD